jgi:hypothetical protein
VKQKVNTSGTIGKDSSIEAVCHKGDQVFCGIFINLFLCSILVDYAIKCIPAYVQRQTNEGA